MSSRFFKHKILDPFEENKSLDEFINHYCQPDSANKCLITTMGYIRNNTNSRTPTDVTNLIFAFHFGLHTTIHITYFACPIYTTIGDIHTYNKHYHRYHQTITVPLHFSLHDIWTYIQHNFTTEIKNCHESLQSIVSPIFTLCSNSDFPYMISDSEDKNKQYFAKILHHKLNPMIVWKYGNSMSQSAAAAVLFGDDILLCVENKKIENKLFKYKYFNTGGSASEYLINYNYATSNTWSKIFINDYTQVTDIHKYNDNIGSSYSENVQLRKILLKIKKGTTLETFFEIVREVCKI
eukprot:41516_1